MDIFVVYTVIRKILLQYRYEHFFFFFDLPRYELKHFRADTFLYREKRVHYIMKGVWMFLPEYF
jgi:hypothetical protein